MTDGLLTKPQDLNEQVLEDIEVTAPGVTNAAVVRLLVGGEHPEGQILEAGALDLAGGDDANAGDIEQQHPQNGKPAPVPWSFVCSGVGTELLHLRQPGRPLLWLVMDALQQGVELGAEMGHWLELGGRHAERFRHQHQLRPARGGWLSLAEIDQPVDHPEAVG